MSQAAADPSSSLHEELQLLCKREAGEQLARIELGRQAPRSGTVRLLLWTGSRGLWRSRLRPATQRRLVSPRCTTGGTRHGVAGGGQCARCWSTPSPTQGEEDEDETREESGPLDEDAAECETGAEEPLIEAPRAHTQQQSDETLVELAVGSGGREAPSASVSIESSQDYFRLLTRL